MKRKRQARAREVLVAESTAMKQVLNRIEELSATSVPVLIEGERGTGRELIARLIHLGSERRDSELISVTAGAAPKQIFIDRIQRCDTAFGQADGGSLLVKNISDLPKSSQRKLGRLLPKRSRRAPKLTTTFNIRVLAIADPDLISVVDAEIFNRKLFDELAANRIWVPPLRERIEDIGPLAISLVREYASTLGKRKLSLSTRACQRMAQYPWPGNVAELKQLCRRLVFRCQKTRIDASDVDSLLPALIERVPLEALSFEEMIKGQLSAFLRRVDGYPLENFYNNVIGRVEKPLLELVMERTGGNQVKAAELLGVGRNTLRKKLTEHGLLVTRLPKRTRPADRRTRRAARKSTG